MTEGLEPTFALITGGGTGGHVYPALALADALVARGIAAERIRFLGARRGLEARAVPPAGFAIDLLAVRGLQRGVAPHQVAANLRAVVDLLRSLVAAFVLLRRLRPRVVVGVGGYASAPGVLVARLLRIPVVVHEQNARPGLVNRLAVRLGARAAVSLPGTALRGATVTGNPVRASVRAVVRTPDADRPLLGIVGGSLGSGRLNDAALGLYDRWRDRTDVRVRHVAGPTRAEVTRTQLARLRRPADRLEYELVAFEDHMDRLYATASLAVCRAGAVTVAELAVAGVPSVLVPWPGAAADHQTANARALVDAGAAVLVPDADLDGERLAAEADRLLAAPERLVAMGRAARTLARPDAADTLADLVCGAAR